MPYQFSYYLETISPEGKERFQKLRYKVTQDFYPRPSNDIRSPIFERQSSRHQLLLQGVVRMRKTKWGIPQKVHLVGVPNCKRDEIGVVAKMKILYACITVFLVIPAFSKAMYTGSSDVFLLDDVVVSSAHTPKHNGTTGFSLIVP